MADEKLTDLTEETSPAATDLVYVVTDPGGSPVNKKCQIGNLPGGGGGSLTLLEQHTASASASLDFTTSISASYDVYLIEFINIVPVTDAALFWMRVSTDGGATYDANTLYSWESIVWRAAAAGSLGATGITKWAIAADLSNTNNSAWGITGNIHLISPLSTSVYTRFFGQIATKETTIPSRIGAQIQGSWESLTAVNAFQFLFSTGNIASGTIRVYGLG